MKKLKITFNSPFILFFVGICAFATLIGQTMPIQVMTKYFTVYHSSLKDPLTFLRMVTHVFGHADWQHFIGNASYILLLGPILEEKYGTKRIVMVMFVTAFLSGLIHYVFFQGQILCGASGIVFALILLTSFAGIKKGEIPVTFILIAVIFIGQQVYEGIFYIDNISHLSHVIGGLVGGLAGCALNDIIGK